jgi:type IV fimbrial biogenesis protein FimT
MQKARRLFVSGPDGILGVSLIELLVVIAVLAILASIAIPSFAGISRQYRVNAAAEEFMASVQLARLDAIRLGQDMVIRRQTSCAVALPTTADWHCGWRVFADLNGNQLPDAGETELQSVALPTGIHLVKAQGGGSPQYITINRYGQVTAIGQRFSVFAANMTEQSGQLICFSTGTRLRTVNGAKTCLDQAK